ncbi:MAG: Fur family transcriptional regulator [Legionellaceae bacterium]
MYPAEFIVYYKTLEVTLTSLRKAVLFSLWGAQKPLKAYDILESLLKIKPGSTAVTVYRVLSFFMSAGIVHKIESIQSYMLCREPDRQLPSEVLMVCHMCHQVKEIYDEYVLKLVKELTIKSHFHLSQETIELRGLCSGCLIH